MSEVKSIETSVGYAGPAVEGGSMDVLQLAPALLAAGQLIGLANQELNGERARARVVVKAFKAGSFESLVGVEVTSILDKARDLFGVTSLADAKDLVQLVFGNKGLTGAAVAGSIGVFQFVKWLKGKAPEKVEPAVSDKSTGDALLKITGNAGATITVHQHVYNLSQNPEARRAVSAMVSPLRGEGVEELRFKSADQAEAEVLATRDDVDAFVAPTSDELSGPVQEFPSSPTDTILVVKVVPMTRASKGKTAHKWKMGFTSDPKETGFFVEITDPDFLADFYGARLYPMYPGAAIKAVLESTTLRRSDGSFSVVRRVPKVLEVFSGGSGQGQQTSLLD